MLKIRFQRTGRRNDPAFRIVLTERRSKPKSGQIEILGSFYPKTKKVQLQRDRISYWLARGAQPSPRVHNILVDQEMITARKMNVVRHAARPPAAAAHPAPTA